MQYTNLHSHDHYSTLDGVPTPHEYASRAVELGMTHLSQTNHGTNAGHREHQRACRDNGLIPILGQEMYFSPTERFDRRPAKDRHDDSSVYNHLTVLARNENGLKNLNAMSDRAWKEGFYMKPRTDMELMEEYNEDLIVLSGCLSGPLAKALERGNVNQAEMFLREFVGIFGERFFIEIMSHNPKEINDGLMMLAKKYGVTAVATSDCHHARKEDLWVQEAMLILSSNPTAARGIDFNASQKMDYLERFNYLYPDRRMSFQEFDLYLHSAQEQTELLREAGLGEDLVANTKIVSDMIEDYPYYEGLDLLPRPAEDEDDLLMSLVEQGLKEKNLWTDEYRQRAKEEMKVITDKKFSTYFIIAADAVNWAREQGIAVGPGRGSAGGSLVCFAVGITEVDPIVHKTLFFRFLSPDRLGWPDADIDFQDSRRHEVKEYVRQKYHHVANIATFGMFKDKGVVRDAARVFKVPLAAVNKALKTVDSYEAFLSNPATKDFRKTYPEVIELADKLRGRIRSIGMHAGGVVIGNVPLSTYTPIQTAEEPENRAGNRIDYVAVDMREAEDIGLIKYDFLGLKCLSVIADAVANIERRHGKKIDLHSLSLNDAKVYEILSQGYTKGCFQVEAAPYTNLLISMGGVKNFEELVASNALVRPGAANSSFGEMYINGKNGGDYNSLHPLTDHFLEDTYYVPLYQEQTMLLCTELAGMSMAESERVRKAIGKKKHEDLEVWGEKFILGASQHIGEQRAIALWNDIMASADYSFNRSHAVAYSMLSYWTAWLKVYYPTEFMTAVLSNEKDKDQLLDYLIETKRMGIRVMLPHINSSEIQFEIQSDEKGDFIRFGLSNIKYISGKVGNRLIEHRPYASYAELEAAVKQKGSGMTVRALQSLNAIGAAVFEDNPRRGDERESFYEYLNIPAFETPDMPPKVKSQFRPLDEYADNETFLAMGMVRKIKTGPGWARVEVVDESGSAGVFTNEHTTIEPGNMYALLVANNRVSRHITTTDIINAGEDNKFVRFIYEPSFPDVPEGMYKVVAFNSRTTKAGKRMGDVVLCDEGKNLTHALVFPSQFMKAYTRLREGEVVDVDLKQTQDGTLFVNNVL